MEPPGGPRKLAAIALPPPGMSPAACWGRNASRGWASDTRTWFLSMRAARVGHDRAYAPGQEETNTPVERLPWRFRQTLQCGILWPAGHNRNSANVRTLHQSQPTSTRDQDPAES